MANSDTGGAGKVVLSVSSILIFLGLVATGELHGLLAFALGMLVAAALIFWWLYVMLETKWRMRSHTETIRKGDLHERAMQQNKAAKQARNRGEEPTPLMYMSFDDLQR